MNIRTIAKLANVSISTVSRVLSNKGDVAPETRQRIMDIMDEVDYVPGTITNRGNSLGVIFSKQIKLDAEGYELQIIRGISEVAFLATHAIVLLPSELKPMRRSELLHLRRTNGLGSLICIAPPERRASGFLESIVESGIPHVMLPNRVDVPGAAWMSPDNLQATTDAVNYLLSLGHRRIGFINDITPTATDRCDRLAGYKETLRQAGCPTTPSLIIESYTDTEMLNSHLQTLFAIPEPPTALLTASFFATLHTCAVLRSHGLSIPKDISLVGFGDITAYEYQDPPLTVIRHPWVEMGRETTRYLLNVMNSQQPASAPIQMELPSTLVIRRSAQPPKSVQPHGA